MPKIRMLPGHGIVGEDKKDWLAGETHDASDIYAAYLLRRGIAELVVEPEVAPNAAPSNRMSAPGKGR